MTECLLTGWRPAAPGYAFNPDLRHMKFYITHDGELYIIAMADPQYCFLFVRTTVFDKNDIADFYSKCIFSPLDDTPVYFMPDGWEHIPETHELLNIQHFGQEIHQAKAEGQAAAWHTPFGHIYQEQPENHGFYFAEDIQKYYDLMRKKCVFREAEGTYSVTMKKQLDELYAAGEDKVKAYESLNPLLDIIAEEEYLKLSDRPIIRGLARRLSMASRGLRQAYVKHLLLGGR